MNIKKLKTSIIFAFLFLITAGIFSGCASQGSDNGSASQEKDGSGSENGETVTAGDGTQDSMAKAMGRYVETMYDASVYSGLFRRIMKNEDGSLTIYDNDLNRITSGDQGITWEPVSDAAQWVADLKNKGFVSDLTLSKGGYMAVKYHSYSQEELKEYGLLPEGTEEAMEEPDIEEPDIEDTDIEDTQNEAEPDKTDDEEGYKPWSWEYFLYTPEGEQILFADGMNIDSLWFSDGDELFAVEDHQIYQVDKVSGAAKSYLTLEADVIFLSFYNNSLSVVVKDNILFYDMEKAQWIEDEMIGEFMKEKNLQLEGYSSDSYAMIVFQEEDNAVYLAFSDGLYRHSIGGNAIELVIDGKLSSFSNPSMGIADIKGVGEREFLVLFTGGQVARYVYDPNIPAVPDKKLTAYSLKKSDTLQQAITVYQQNNPDVFVKYQIGMDENSSITREDALKKLNVDIMAGNGPDLLILDGLPVESYLQKGILADLTPYLEELELLPQAMNTCRRGEMTYGAPSMFKVPIIAGEEEVLAGISDLNTLADTVEGIRKERPEGYIISGFVEEEMLMKLVAACAPAWQKEDATLDEAAIKEFFTQAKRIYQAEIAGITKQEIDQRREQITGGILDYTRRGIFGGLFDGATLAAGDTKIEIGPLDGIFSFATLTSAMEISPYENLIFDSFSGQAKGSYYPMQIAGISASSANQAMAGELLKALLSKETQTLVYGGYPVNREAFNSCFVYEDTAIGGMSFTSRDGKEIVIDIQLPKQSDLDKLRKILEEADTPVLINPMLAETVFEEGIGAINGEKTVEEAVLAVKSKMSIYMAE